jgi:SAM-dependent methyltransferase
VRKIAIDGRSEPELLRMVRGHYDSEPLMRLEGEIHFDAALSRAEVEAAALVYGRPMPPVAYLPCCGTLRHVPALLERGVERLVAVDLSLASLRAGLMRNAPDVPASRLSVYHADVRHPDAFLPGGGVPFVFLGGNSLGDVTSVEGHAEFIRSLAAALTPGGVLVFDYVGDRYAPGTQDAVTEWPETYLSDTGDIAVIDTRTRRSSPVPGTAMSILRFTSKIRHARTGELIVEAHGYDKLVVPDALLAEQFADAGLELTNAGRMADLSPYHRERIRRTGDLGMLGEPDCLYRDPVGKSTTRPSSSPC